jgi:hypothetical protein
VVLEEGGAAAVLFWCFGPDSGVLRWWWKLFLPHRLGFYCFSGSWCGEAVVVWNASLLFLLCGDAVVVFWLRGAIKGGDWC